MGIVRSKWVILAIEPLDDDDEWVLLHTRTRRRDKNAARGREREISSGKQTPRRRGEEDSASSIERSAWQDEMSLHDVTEEEAEAEVGGQ